MIIKRLNYEFNEWLDTNVNEFHKCLNTVQPTSFETAKRLWVGMLNKSGLTWFHRLKNPTNEPIEKIREQFSFRAFNDDGTIPIYTPSDFEYYLKWKDDNPSPKEGESS